MFSPSLCMTWVHPSIAKGKSFPFKNTLHSAFEAVAICRWRECSGSGLGRGAVRGRLGRCGLRPCRHRLRHARVRGQRLFNSIETCANFRLKESGCVFFDSFDKTLRLFQREWLAPVAFGDRLLMAPHQVVKAVKRLLLFDETAQVRGNSERDGVVLS